MLGGIIGGAAGLAGGILGGISKNKMLKKQMRMVNEQKKENQDWFDRRYNEDATQRADAQAMLARTMEETRRRNRQAAGSQAVTGGTDESVAAAREENSKALAEAASQIAVAGEQRKDSIESKYMERKNQLDETLRALRGQRQSGLDIANAAIGGAASGLASGMQLENLTKDGKKSES